MHELTAILVTTVLASTPMLFAALGELVTEKSGVLNLGVEGMMLLGAVVGFSVTAATGHASFGIVCAAIAGAATAAIFAVLTLIFLANQVACGLALTIFGIGLSALVGKPFLGRPLERIPQLNISGLSDIPLIGPLLFGQDALVYLSIAMAVAVHFFLNRTRPGLIVRAVGENHDAAHALGYPVVAIRFFAVLFGGAMCGIGGSYLSLAYTPLWSEGHDRRARMDRTRLRHLLHLALVARRAGRLSVRLLHHRPIARPGFRRQVPARIPVDGALSGDDRGVGPDLAQGEPGAHARACLPRQGFP